MCRSRDVVPRAGWRTNEMDFVARLHVRAQQVLLPRTCAAVAEDGDITPLHTLTCGMIKGLLDVPLAVPQEADEGR